MPFRSEATLQSWLEEFVGSGYSAAGSARVIAQDGAEGANTGLVVFQFQNAPTLAYLQPELPSLEWVITFEARDVAVPMSPSRVMNLAHELTVLSTLAAFLQAKSQALTATVAPAEGVAEVVRPSQRETPRQ